MRGGNKREKNVFLAMQQEILAQEHWIIEGCALSSLECRFACADKVLYLCLPRLLCLGRMVKRCFFYQPGFGGLRKITADLIRYMWCFDRKNRENIQHLASRYPQVCVEIFHWPAAVKVLYRKES